MNRLLTTVLMCIAAFASGYAATVDTLSIQSSYLASDESIVVITPEVDSNASFPTVYLLNGYSDNHLAWLRTRPDLPNLADEYGFIFVLPDGRDSWYWDSPVDTSLQMESFITDVLVPYIDANYPTLPVSEKRAISGLSMGGHGALWLAMRHPDIWGNTGSMSGGLDIRPFPDRWKMKERLGELKDNPQLWDDHTVINLVKDLKPGELNIIIDCGTDDFFFEVNENMHKALLDAGIPHDYISRPGGHTHPYWANSLLYHLLFFNENFNK